jgi:phage gp46-like protein
MSDPRLYLTANGTSLKVVGGEPLMDNGLENLALISLFTSPGWCGNKFLIAPIGSDFEAACNQPITRQALNNIRNAAERAMVSSAFGKVTVAVSNPNGYSLAVSILIEPPGGRPASFLLTRNGQNWQYQALMGVA